ncbi:BhlA/UviB family holin-like peptide [Clostridium tagluense]|uniref:BhlA/UviB family holin-like peptide n=1 Tax=Clostridium tagluense TaxID=360422 RepID=UPI001C0AAEF8|nr:BhlA/UviB family holin-like peptide [Clostridium tagluense]MBU3126732.1 UviB-like protein [Clostridium tagluense]
MDAIMAKAIGQGLGYAMFVFLLFYVLKKQETRDANSELRETKYQNIIEELTSTVNVKLDKLIDKMEK